MEEEIIQTCVSETSHENIGTPTRYYDDGNITSPFRWCSNQCQTVLLTSPLRHVASLKSNPDSEHNQTSNDISFNTLEFNVATPPPPTPCTLIKAAKIPLTENDFLASPKSRQTVVSRFFGLYGCSASIQKSIEQLGWVAEQLLCAPLEKISHILQSLQYKCNGAEWQQLLRLRDSFLQCAISHLELNLPLHSHVFSSDAIPFSVNTILTQFFRLAESIDNRLVTKRTLPVSVEDPSLTVKDKPPLRLQLSQFPIPSASLQCTDTIMPEPNSHSNEESLNKKLISIIRKETIKRMGKIFTSPIQNDIPLEMDSTSLKYYSSPVIRRAQRRLGDIWNLMDEFGSGDQLVEAIYQNAQPQKSTCTLSLFKKQQPFVSHPFSMQSKNSPDTAMTMGALSLMGARYIRKGRYISKKNVLAQRKRTREKNKKRNLALDNADAKRKSQNLIPNKEYTKECISEKRNDYLFVSDEEKKSTKQFQDSDSGTIFIMTENSSNDFALQLKTEHDASEVGKRDICLMEKLTSELSFFKHFENKNITSNNQNIPNMYTFKEKDNNDWLNQESKDVGCLSEERENVDLLTKENEESDSLTKKMENIDSTNKKRDDSDCFTKKGEDIHWLNDKQEENASPSKKRDDSDCFTKKGEDIHWLNDKQEENASPSKKRDESISYTSEPRQLFLTPNDNTGTIVVKEPDPQHNDSGISNDCSLLLEKKCVNFSSYEGRLDRDSAGESVNKKLLLDTEHHNLNALAENGNDSHYVLENEKDKEVLGRNKIDEAFLISTLHKGCPVFESYDIQTHWNEANELHDIFCQVKETGIMLSSTNQPI